jgi:hypothetical protein
MAGQLGNPTNSNQVTQQPSNLVTQQPATAYFNPGRISSISLSNLIEIPFVTTICLR